MKGNTLRILYVLLLLAGPVLLITCSVLLALENSMTMFDIFMLIVCFLAVVWYAFKVYPAFKQLYVDIKRAKSIKNAK